MLHVLLLSVTAGQGHNSCARSLAVALEARGVACQTVDTIKYINSLTGTAVDKGYLTMGKYTPKFWGTIYNQALQLSMSGKPAQINLPLPQRFVKLIAKANPDAIVCTHFFASLLLTKMRRKRLISMPVFGINTDFTLHPFWEDVDQDYLVLACDQMHYSVQKRGIPPEKTLPFGIPVNANFGMNIDKHEARKMLGLQDKNTMLLMGGSMGFGDLTKQVDELDALPHDFQIVVICGSNKQLYAELKQRADEGKFHKTVLPYQYVDNVHVFMYASDIVCTKPGGLSTSEAMSVGRPIVMLDPIPGLEEINAAFLVNSGAAVQTGKHYPLSEAVYNLMRSPERCEAMIRAQLAVNPPSAADNLADFVIRQAESYRARNENGGVLYPHQPDMRVKMNAVERHRRLRAARRSLVNVSKKP